MNPKHSKLDVAAEIGELRELQAGWINDDGKAFDGAALGKLTELFMLHYPDNLPMPDTFPTEDAGILFKWRIGVAMPSVEIDLATFQGEWLSADDEASLDMSTAGGWAALVARARVAAVVRPARKRSGATRK